MKRILSIATIVLVITFGAIEVSSGQNKSDPFADVPLSHRDRLKMRLSDFVEYHRNKQWDKVYELIGEQYKNAVKGGLPKDEFLRKKLYSHIRRFTPKSVQKMGDGWWMIWGCGTFDRGGNIEAGMEAYFQDGDWYFSDIWSVAPCIDCMPERCKH